MLEASTPKTYSGINLGLFPLKALCIIYGTMKRLLSNMNQLSSSKKYIRTKNVINPASIRILNNKSNVIQN
jgi:hypothetical protein